MISRYPALGFVFLFFVFLYAFHATGQPTLPDIAGAADKGVVVLSWNCQYNGVKVISVLRSPDNVSNYSVIGYVKNIDKGLQVFVDGHPAAGENCYKLGLVFKSGLKWSSNHYCAHIEAPAPEAARLPPNDSLQKMIVTQDVPKEEKPAAILPETNPGRNNAPGTENSSSQRTDNAIPANTAPPLESAKKFNQDKASVQQPKISVAIGADTLHLNGGVPGQNTPITPRKKIVISFEEPDENTPTQITSRYIAVDPVSGNIIMTMPDDVATHHYSIKFYDEHNKMVTEVPRINVPKIIMDKRNFQRKGIYKFKLRRDVVELEAGYISITP